MGSKSGKWVRMPIRKNIRSPFALNTSLTCRAAFSDGVDWSAILIDLWEAPGWLMSELVNRVGSAMSAVSPLYPQEPTSSVRSATSEKCHIRTHALRHSGRR